MVLWLGRNLATRGCWIELEKQNENNGGET